MQRKKSKKSSYEGRQDKIRTLKTPKIEIWKNKYPDKEYMIRLDTLDFTCICPKTGLPDFAALRINYIPGETCIELKSFKYYLNFFRDIGIFHEHSVNKIMEDIIKSCRPRFLRIEAEFNPRGGITTTVSRTYAKD